MNREEILSRIYENMSATKRLMQNRMPILPGRYQISRSQMELLFTLKHLATPHPSPKQLAAHMHLTPGAVSQLTEGLVEQGLLTRQINPDDRRTQTLQISEAGHEAIHAIKKQRHEMMKHVMQSLTTEELQILLQIQEKLTKQLAQIDKVTK